MASRQSIFISGLQQLFGVWPRCNPSLPLGDFHAGDLDILGWHYSTVLCSIGYRIQLEKNIR